MGKTLTKITKSLLVLSCLIFTSNIFATKYYVNNTYTVNDVFTTASGAAGNSGLLPSSPKATLTQAYGVASSGDTIYIDNGTYNDNSLTIAKSLTIIGAGPGNTIFDGANTGNYFINITASNVKIYNILIERYFKDNSSFGQVININGAYSGIELDGIIITKCLGGTVTLPNLNVQGGASVTVRNSVFKCSGYNGSSGGGISVTSSTLVVQNTLFYQNENHFNNGGAIQISGASSNVSITSSTFDTCLGNNGGAISISAGTLTISGSCFSNNQSLSDNSSDGGGAIYINGSVTTSFSNCTFTSNLATNNGLTTSSADGCAIKFWTASGTTSINTCTFTSNGATVGFDKGLDIFTSEAGGGLSGTITNCTFNSSKAGEVNIYNNNLANGDINITFSNGYTIGGTSFTNDGLNHTSSAITSCVSTTNIAPCSAIINCATETNAPVIISCVQNKTINGACSTTLLDYRSEVVAYDDCSISITQSPVAGTIITSGTTVVTMTITDQAGNSSICTFNVTVTGGSVTAPIIGTITQPTCAVSTGSVDLSGLPASGNWTLTPSTGATVNNSGTTYTFTGLTASTSFTFTVTDDQGCTSPASVSVDINAQPVTSAPTGNANQSFCAINNPTVTNLVATGTAIFWYDAATNGNVLVSNTPLVDGTHYFASQTVAACESATRLDILVTISNPTAPTGNANQTFCAINNPTVTDLVATGTAIIWYDAATNGNVVASNTPLVNGTHYYASQTVGGCESATRLDVTVVISNPTAPTGSANQSFCAINNPTVTDLVATGTAIIWYDAATNGNVVASNTPLVNGTDYYASQTVGGCESATRLDVTVVISNPTAPTGNANQTFCAINNPTVTDLVATGTAIIWYDAATNGNVVASNTPLVNGTHYYASQTVGGCESATRLDVTVVISNPTAPTGSANQSFCAINNPTVTDLVATGTAIIWYDAATNGNVVASNTPLVNGTHYYASQTVGGCESATRLDVLVTISNPTAPTGNTNQTFCAINNPTVTDLVATGTAIIWDDAATNGNVVASNTPLVDGTHYFASQTVAGCESASRLDVTVVISNPTAPTGNANQTFCAINNPTVTDLVATGTAIIWYDAATNGNVVASNTPLVDDTHYFASQTVAGCESASRLDVTVVISNPTAPTGNANQTFCAINNPTVTDLVATGTAIIWYDAATNGNVVASNTPLVNGTHYYASQTVGGCESATRLDVTVVISNPTAPTGNANQTFCAINNPTVADLVATGTAIIWYDAVTNGNVVASNTPLVDGTHYFASQTVAGCEGISRLDVAVHFDSLKVSMHKITKPTCGKSNGEIEVNVEFGTSPFTFDWSNGTSNQNLTEISAGSYQVTIEDSIGCTQLLTITVNCDRKEIPQIITPGGNGKNETWILNLDPSAKVSIYNRWGSLVFAASPYMDDWDGKSNASASIGDSFLPSGTYFYVIDMNNGEKPVSGYIELVK